MKKGDVDDGSGALQGTRILDFSWVITGPLATKFLANLGATVVKVEYHTPVDLTRYYPPFAGGGQGIDRSATYAKYNDGKYGMMLNLNHPRSREVAEPLIRWADVVVENFTPGTMEKWNLGYEQLREMNPGIIMVRASLMGQTGPYARHPGFGTMLQAYAGFTYAMRWPDRMPAGTSVPWTDYTGAGFTAIAILAALDYRRRWGRGTCVDLSQLEAAQQLLMPDILSYTVNGHVDGPACNRHASACPHGVYPCQGEDRWLAVAAFTDAHWEGLKQVMGYPEWAEDPRFSSLTERKTNEDALDQLLGQWTRGCDAGVLMEELQRVGVPAGAVANGEDLHEDPQLRHRGHFVELKHPGMGTHAYHAPPFRLSKTPHRMERPAPRMGEHTEWVCRELLGMDDETFQALQSEGVFM